MTATYATLIEPADLNYLIAAGNVVVIDCRFSLSDTSSGHVRYREAHIPGALYAHLDDDLSSAIVADESGRHPLPDPDVFTSRLRSWGINNDTQIVVYDDAAGAIAARTWWLCQWIGHERCAVLNGGFQIWQAMQLPLSTECPLPALGNVTRRPSEFTFIDASDVLDVDRLLVDARDHERYTGNVEPLDAVGGHIPGAINLPFTGNFGGDKRFLDPVALRNRFEPLLKSAAAESSTAKTITHYCGSGVTAAHNVLAMVHLGYPVTALYAGSWSEWIQDKNRPVATGD